MAASQTLGAGAPKARKRSRWGRRLLIVIVLFALAGFLLMRYAMQAQQQPSPFEAELDRSYPNVKRAMKTVAASLPNGSSLPDSQLMAIVARTGFQRLDDQSILDLIALRAQLAQESDVETCAGLWSGDAPAMIPAIEALPDDQQRQWGQLLDRAALATINNSPAMPIPSNEVLQAALNRASAKLSPADVELLRTMLGQPGNQASSDRCRAARIVWGAMLTAPRNDAVTIARALIAQ